MATSSATAKPCQRFTQDGDRCKNTTTNPNGWCGQCYGAKKARKKKPVDTTKASADALKLVDGPKETPEDATKRLMAEVESGVEKLTTSEGWQEYLDTASKFHTYSLNNQILIARQRPDATKVMPFGNKAGTTGWKSIGRHVKKGEKAIKILAPITITKTVTDPATGDEEKKQVLVGWKPVPVFDVAQTDGKPLPSPVTMLEGEEPPHMAADITAMLNDAGYEVHHGEGADAQLPPGANGSTNFTDRVVTIRTGLSPAQRAKTLAHELGHVLLHEPTTSETQPPPQQMEVEAESVAYIISKSRGMNSSDYSMGYVAHWAKGDTETVKKAAGRVRAAASGVLARFEQIDSARSGADKAVA